MTLARTEATIRPATGSSPGVVLAFGLDAGFTHRRIFMPAMVLSGKRSGVSGVGGSELIDCHRPLTKLQQTNRP
jgi:hypothetical protein